MCIEIICRKAKYCGSWRNGGGCSVKSMFLRITKAGLVFVSLVCSWWILPVHWKVRQLSASTQHPSLISSLPATIFFPLDYAWLSFTWRWKLFRVLQFEWLSSLVLHLYQAKETDIWLSTRTGLPQSLDSLKHKPCALSVALCNCYSKSFPLS